MITRYASLAKNSFGADLPTRSQTCSKAFAAHDTRIKRPIRMAPMGSTYQTTRLPTMDMARPKALTTMSLRWSMKNTCTEG